MNRQRPMQSRGGFTLVEMLVVLGILVVLVSLVTPRVLRSMRKADIKTATIQIGKLQGSLEEYASDVKAFPTTEEGLNALVERPADLDETVNWQGPYTDSIPKDPWGQDYQYEYPPTHGTTDRPDIWSMGPDKQDGTEDDICSWADEQGAGGQQSTSDNGTGAPGSQNGRGVGGTSSNYGNRPASGTGGSNFNRSGGAIRSSGSGR